MLKCSKCDKYLFTSFDEKHHDCKKFTIYDPYEDYTHERYADDAEDAIERFAIERNTDDIILNDDIFELPMKVTDEDGIEKWYQVYAEPEINHYPKEVAEPTKKEIEDA